ncbi:hypothetical protein [Lentzea sp. NPDC092896]|uniref:hypothetical protein n=1 Tax=Lentzea sp. NPDC092896 TaxID=3364127 RepID=UPI003823D7BF
MTQGLFLLAALLRYLGCGNSTPPPALRGSSSSVPPNGNTIEDDRIARELVPLVRAAADEVYVGDVPRLDLDLARLGFYSSCSLPNYAALAEQSRRTAMDDWVAGQLGSPHGFLTPGDLRASVGPAREPARRHEGGTDCWCNPVLVGRFPFHVDPSVPRGELLVEPALDALAADNQTVTTVPTTSSITWEEIVAVYDKMLAPPRPPRRVEPFKLTREQIDQLPKAGTQEQPFAGIVSRLDGFPVVEVLTVEESTPHAEGWCLTFEQAFRGITKLDHRGAIRTDPLYLTRQQIERMSRVLWFNLPDNWEQLLEQGGGISQIMCRPVHLVHHPASSTPCLERWMDQC